MNSWRQHDFPTRQGKRPRAPFLRFTLLLLTALFIVADFAVADTPQNGSEPGVVISSAAEIDYPPFSMIDENGEATGFSVELLRSALAAMGREVTFETGPWSEVRGWLERGEVDVLPLVGRTPEREALFDFTVPYMSLHGAIVVRGDEKGVRDLADLRGRRVAVMKGDNAEEFLRREERDFEIYTTPTFEAAFQQLSEGRYDAVVVQRLVALRLIQQTGLTNLQVIDRPIDGFKQDFCFAVHEGDRETLALLNEGLALVVADGTYRHLHAKWFADMQLPTNRPIVVGGDLNYPPFEFLDENGRPAGYNVDLTHAIARAMDLRVEIQLGRWSERVDALKTGKIDVLQGMFYSPERDRNFDFSPAHAVSHYVAVVRQGEGPAPESIEALGGRRIVILRGDLIHDFVLKHGLEEQITLVDAQEAVLRDLRTDDRYDCALVARDVALSLIEKYGWDDLVLGEQPLLSTEYCYAVAEGQKALLAKFSEGLRVLEQSGEYRQIYDKWLGVYQEQSVTFAKTLRYSAMVIIPLLLILLVVFSWLWALRRQVARQTAELRTSEESIRQDRERLRTIIEGSHLGTWEWNVNTGKTVFNAIWAEQLGYTIEELSPYDIDTWKQLVHPEDRERVQSALQDCFAGRTIAYDCEHRLKHKSGRWVWILDRGRVVRRDDDGQPLLMFGTHTDVTRLKLMEEQAKTATIQLHEAVRAAHIGLWDWDLVTNLVSYSLEWKKQIGYRDNEIGNNFEEWENRVHPDDLEPTINQIRQAIRDKSSHLTVEFRFRHKNGSYRWILAQGSIIVDSTGDPVRAVGSHIDITDRKEAEEVLRLREKLQRTILQTTGDGYWLTDHTGKIIDVNDTACRMTGYKREELTAMAIEEIDVIDSVEDVAARMERIHRNGHELFETQHRRKDGTILPVEISSTMIDIGQQGCFVNFCRDLTERKRAEEHLRAANVRLEALWSVSSLVDADNKKVSDQVLSSLTRMTNSPYGFYGFVNDDDESVMTIYSWSGLAMQDCNMNDNPSHYPIDKAGIWAEAVRHRQPFIMNDYRNAHPAKRGIPEGHVLLKRLLVVPFLVQDKIRSLAAVANRATAYNEDDVVQIQSFLASIQAILDRKQAEEELRSHKEMLSNIARMVPGFIYQYRRFPDGRSTFPYASSAVIDIFEATPDEVRDDAAIVYSRLHPEDRDQLTAKVLGSAETQEAFHCEYRVLLPRQGLRWHWSEAQPQLLEDGSTLWHGIILDITEQKQAEEAHEQVRQQLVQAQKMESVGRLAGGVAHDFNNMLGVMLGYSEMGLEQVDEDTPVYAALSAIHQAALRSSDLTRQLLAFARKQTIEPRIIDLNKTIKNMLAMLRRLIGEDIELDWQPGNLNAPIFLDPVQIDQILANLCVNARDAIDGTGTITIRTVQTVIGERRYGKYGTVEPGDYVVLSISDSGCGMDTGTMEQMFEPFFTSKQLGEGTGLGLATVFGIVQQNKGFIEVESKPGLGATFRIGFPCHLPGVGKNVMAETRQEALIGSETILLVEDEISIRQMTARMLERLGYHVISASSPGEAIALVNTFENPIDLLLTDVIMPGMNGRDLAARLQDIQPNLRCLFISGYTADVLNPHGVLEPRVNFLQKPFSRVDLSRKVRDVLDEQTNSSS